MPAQLPAEPLRPTPGRVLHVFAVCGRAGTEAVIRFLIQGLAREGVASEAFFQRDLGGGDLFRSLCPVHWEQEKPLAEVIAQGGFDAIHAVTSSLTIGLVPALRAARFRGPVIGSCHNDYVIGWNSTNAGAIVALTGWWAEKIRRYTDLPVEVIGNPVDLDRFRPPSAQILCRTTLTSGCTPSRGDAEVRSDLGARVPLVGWVGRSADRKKNVGRLISVMRLTDPAEFRFAVADGNQVEDPEALFPGLGDRLESYGRIGYQEMPAYYGRLAAPGGVLLSTADDEALPMSVLEAMACGCPAVVPDAWGSDEIVDHGRTGLVYRRADGPEAIHAALLELRDPATHASMSRAARQAVEARFSLEAVTARYLDVMRRAPLATEGAVAGALWSLHSLGHYLSLFRGAVPESMFLYRPRAAQEALNRAVSASEQGRLAETRAELLEALGTFPPLFLRSWRARFLVKTMLGRSSG